jgi:tRNA pseudouridine55 synthase
VLESERSQRAPLPTAGRLLPTTAGFLNVCKAPGFTSHDVVAVLRRLTGIRRIGHAGTLDPAAEGVLPICLGRATRLVDRLADADKGYYAEIVLGVRTRTDDAEGEVIATAPVPDLDHEALTAALAPFRGRISQTPPAFSAVKVAGRRAYDLARRGEDVHLRPREVTVHDLRVRRWEPPRLALTIHCSKGTYIRSIARDLGEALGCGAHLSRLVRLWVGAFQLGDAHSLDELREAAEAGQLSLAVIPADIALLELPAAIVETHRVEDMRHGRAWPMAALHHEGLARVYDTDGRFLGLAEADQKARLWRPKLYFE